MGWDAEDAQAAADALSWEEKQRILKEIDGQESYPAEMYQRELDRIDHDMKILAQESDEDDTCEAGCCTTVHRPPGRCTKPYSHGPHEHSIMMDVYFCDGKNDLPTYDAYMRSRSTDLSRALDLLPPGAQLQPGKFVIKGTRTGRMSVQHPPYDYVVHPDGTYESKETDMAYGHNIHVNVSGLGGNELSHRIDQLKAELAKLREQEEFLKSLPAEPGIEDTTLAPVIYFEHRFHAGDKSYKYVGIKVKTSPLDNGVWFLAGNKAPQGQTWHELLLWLMETGHNHKLPEIKFSYAEDFRDLQPMTDAE